jgi:hypothetical protein
MCIVGEDPFRHLFCITPLPFTITCPNVTFPEVTKCIHKSNPRLTKKGFISEPVDP